MEISASLFSFNLHVYVDRYVGKKEEERKGKGKKGRVGGRKEERKEGEIYVISYLYI